MCHQQFEIMKKKCSAVVAINLLLLDEDVDQSQILEMLQTDVLNLTIIEDCLGAYIEYLLAEKQTKVSKNFKKKFKLVNFFSNKISKIF